LAVEKTVPQHEENLFVPKANWGGIPTLQYAGREIKPPPPAIESIRPAKKMKGSTRA